MKKKLLKALIMLTKKFVQIFIIQVVFYSFGLANGGNSQNLSLKDVYVRLNTKNVEVLDVLKQIEARTDFKFNYESQDVEKNISFSFNKGRNSVYQILAQVSKKASLKFKRINGIIDVTRSTTKSKTVSVEDTFKSAIVKGTVTDENDEALPGVSVVIKGTTMGTTTDLNGNFAIDAPVDATLSFSFIGYITQEIGVGGRSVIDIKMVPDIAQLEEIVVVGFGTQKKESVVGAITSIKPAELKVPASNLTSALAGRVAGVVSYQTSGEPGEDNAQFFVRGVASFNDQNGPLILIDGVELTADDLARLQPDDIESFSVLKDPTTTAIYGARGANGIILVTTKTGDPGPARVSLRLENSISEPVSLVDLADPVTHMRLQNEAARTRGQFAPFTLQQIAGVERGLNSNVFPAVDWYDELFKHYTTTQRANINVNGGGENVRYYVAGSFTNDNGLLKVDPINDFNNNISLKRYLLRSNINIDLTKNTEMIVRLHSTIDDYRGPIRGGSAFFNAAVRTSPARFPAVFARDANTQGIPFTLYGNGSEPRNATGLIDTNVPESPVWFNPYAELQRGFAERRRQLSLVQLEFKQDLGSILPGLSARFLGNANTTSQFENIRTNTPSFYQVESFNPANPDENVLALIGAGGNSSLEFEEGATENNSVLYMEAAVNYAGTFNNKHNTSGLLVVIAREFLNGNAGSVITSLPSRNLGLSGRFNYDYDNRYFAEFNFGYNGSERFGDNNRYGFFPSAGIGWLISNESFFNVPSSVISRLKLRASYGEVGNDNIGNGREDRFFFLSDVTLLNAGTGSVFGQSFNQGFPGVAINNYSNPQITWELAQKSNLGLELNFMDDAIQFRVDAFREVRSDILQVRQDIPSTTGLQAVVRTNVGEVEVKGIDASLDMNHYFNDIFWVTARTTFTFADNEFKIFEEPEFANAGAPWRSRIGDNVSQQLGLIAERLFVDDAEAINSPQQLGRTPGEDYGGGDIKYKDLNNDGVIDDLDRTGIGNPTVPKITYGMGVSAGYKKWDINVFFQGLGQYAFFINPVSTGPFVNSLQSAEGLGFGTNDDGELVIPPGNGAFGENALIQYVADDYWTEENRNVFARWPRLSQDPIPNNTELSTFWLRNAAFLRLKQVEVGYTIFNGPESNKWNIDKLRIYVTGTNLHVWGKWDVWDPELGSDGLNYPLQRIYNLGVQVNF